MVGNQATEDNLSSVILRKSNFRAPERMAKIEECRQRQIQTDLIRSIGVGHDALKDSFCAWMRGRSLPQASLPALGSDVPKPCPYITALPTPSPTLPLPTP